MTRSEARRGSNGPEDGANRLGRGEAHPEPTPEADASKLSDIRLLGRLWPYLRPDAWLVGIALLLTPLIAVANLAQPWLLKRAIDEHLVPEVSEGLRDLAYLYLVAVVGGYLVEVAYTLSISWAGGRSILRLRMSLYRYVLGLAQSFFDGQAAGKLLTRLTSDIESLGEALGAGVITIVLDVLMIIGTLGAMLWLDARLTLVWLLAAPPLLLVLDLLRRRLRALYMEIREALARVNAFLAERIDGIEIVQLYRNEDLSLRRFDRLNRQFRDACSRSNVYDAFMYSLVDGTSRVLVGLMLWYGAGLGAQWLGRVGVHLDIAWVAPVSAGLVVAFIDYIDRLFRPLRELSGKVAVLQRAAAALSKIFGLFEQGITPEPGTEALGEVAGHLVLRDVRFRYRPDAEDVLRGLDLDVKPGEVVAIVGATGSGKTTLTRLLNRAYDGYRGSIQLDGRELSRIKLADLRRRVAAVRQDIQVFSESVRFNVDLGNADITLEDCSAAARLVHADGFVKRLGWSHVLRERGADLSVGEGQLLTFARTMAHDPDLIILDEATASVDSLTESLVQDAIARILERKTVIVVAHRLSTIRHADRIVVMEGGRVVEEGRHDELVARGGRYAELLAAGRGVLGDG